uniref:FYVE-type domain-containing protein n=1 Tax=Globodera rostochiensis TaxID=31243 RepID=A0A914H157_GLORO
MDAMSFVPSLTWPSTSVDDRNTFSKRAIRIGHENERNNLLAIIHLVLNSLLDDAIRSNRMLLDGVETREVNDFFVMFEKVLWHGFRPSSSLLVRRRPEAAELWTLIGQASKENVDMGDLYKSINEMRNLNSPIGRIRAFWRLAMMQKRLSDYFHALFEFNGKNDFYECRAFMRNDCCAFLCGSLLALNVFDCNLPIENDQLQEQINSFELSPYLRLPTLPGHMPPNSAANGYGDRGDLSVSGEELALVLSQKQYLEERNRQLCLNNEQLRRKLERLEVEEGKKESNGSIASEDRSLVFTDRLRDLEHERDILRARLAEKEDSVRISQEQLTDMKKFTEDLYEKLKAAESRVKRLKKDICQMNEIHEKEMKELNGSLNALQQNKTLTSANEEAESETTGLNRLQTELIDKTKQYMETMSNLKGKQQELSRELEQNAALRRRNAELEARVEALAKTEKELFNLNEEYRRSKQQLIDCQMALQEFSEALSESKLRMVELKEEIMPLSEAEWMEDSRAVQCRMCDIQFGVLQRKHHCRNCGQIFCNACSSGRVKMPSSAQPVRVCLNCFHLLRNRQLSITAIVRPARDGRLSPSPSASSLVGLR